MSSVTNEVAEKAIEKLQRGWTKGTLARNDKGKSCAATSREACSWCLYGALFAAEADVSKYNINSATRQYNSVVNSLIKILTVKYGLSPLTALAKFNDAIAHDVDEVVGMIRKAIGERSE